MKISVVIPAYNEEATIRDCVLEVLRMYPNAEVVVVNDKSTDNTYKILRSFQRSHKQVRILTNKKNSGHGASVVRGILATHRDYVLYIDADQQIDLMNLRRFMSYDFVSGYRVHRQDKLFRKFISFGLKMTNLFWHHKYIRDANCPFKFYNGSIVRSMLRYDYIPSTNIIPIACLDVMARKHKLTTLEVPVLHHKYFAERRGMLQTLNRKSIRFIWDAFKEITSL